MQSLRIGYIIDSLSAGGAERLLVDVANAFSCKYEVIVIVLHGPYTLEAQLNPSIKVYKLNISARIGYLLKVGRAKAVLRENHINILHSHLVYSILFCRMIMSKAIRQFNSYHNLDYCKGSTYYSKYMVMLDRCTSRTTITSIYVSKAVEGCVSRVKKGGRQLVLPNFANNKFSPCYTPDSQKQGLKILVIGNLKKVKNIQFYIDVFKLLKRDKDMGLVLDIYGGGDQFEVLNSQIVQHGLPIRLMGSVAINNAVFSKYDLFSMSSLQEGMPIALLEAISCGLPSLLPDHLDVMKEVAEDSAWYFDIDDENSFITRIKYILENREQLAVKSVKATYLSKRYSLEHHVDVLENIYSVE